MTLVLTWKESSKPQTTVQLNSRAAQWTCRISSPTKGSGRGEMGAKVTYLPGPCLQAGLPLQNIWQMGTSPLLSLCQERRFPWLLQESSSVWQGPWSAGFPLSKQDAFALEWADHGALINKHFTRAFKNCLWKQGSRISGVFLRFNLEKASFQMSLYLSKVKQAMKGLSNTSLFDSFLL